MDSSIPLMDANISKEDLQKVIEFLQRDPILTNNKEVRKFEEQWSEWLGVKHSVFVNSGSSANFLTMAIIKELYGEGEIIVPPLTWVSDIVSVVKNNLTPVFADISLNNLAMNEKQILSKITNKTKAVFLTHILGLNGLSDSLLKELQARNIPLIEDVCESHGATFNGSKLGTFGLISNFSFYYGHHLATIEGGMICTDDDQIYQMARMFRSHGMTREATDEKLKEQYEKNHPDLRKEFIFAYPGFNCRSNEINAVLGQSQLTRLDANNGERRKNFELFLKRLDPKKYFTDFDTQGSCNYALILITKEADERLRDSIVETLSEHKIEFRRGTSGGGNQLRQPYLKKIMKTNPEDYPVIDFVHFFGFYIGNYPSLANEKIERLCQLLNRC